MPISPTILIRVFDGVGTSDSWVRRRGIVVEEKISSKELGGGSYYKEKVLLSDSIEITHQHYLSHITPGVVIYSWDYDGVSPSGNRHVEDGSSSFLSNVTDLGYLDFGERIESTPIVSDTRVITVKVEAQSGVFGINNCKLWCDVPSGLGVYPDDISVNFLPSYTWLQGSGLPSGVGTLLETSLPSSQNIFRNDGEDYLDSGATEGGNATERDKDTSQYVYLSVNMGSMHGPGKYGYGGSGILNMKITYDYFIGGTEERPSVSGGAFTL